MRSVALLLVLSACGSGRTGGAPSRNSPASEPQRSHLSRERSEAVRCVVERTFAPASLRFALFGCPAELPALASELRPCRVDWGNDVSELSYDSAGRLVAQTRALAAPRFEYDASGFITSIRWPAPNDHKTLSIEVTRAAGVVTMTGPLGRVTRFEMSNDRVSRLSIDDQDSVPRYDSEGLITEMASVHGTVRFDHDRDGLLVRVHDGPRTQSYAYDANGRLLAITGGETAARVEYDCIEDSITR